MDWISLPADIQFSVFQFVDVPTIVRKCSLVCRSWNKVTRENDLLWKSLVKTTFSLSEEDANELLSQWDLNDTTNKWYSLFKHIVSDWFSWDPENSHPKLNVKGKLVFATGIGSYLPLRGKLGVKKGIFYFGINVVMLNDSSSSLACGVGSEDFVTKDAFTRGYIPENCGIGWYCSGNIFSFNQRVEVKTPFSKGDHVGFLLNMNEGYVSFYKNYERIHFLPSHCNTLPSSKKIYPGLLEVLLGKWKVFLVENGTTVELTPVINIRERLRPFK